MEYRLINLETSLNAMSVEQIESLYNGLYALQEAPGSKVDEITESILAPLQAEMKRDTAARFIQKMIFAEITSRLRTMSTDLKPSELKIGTLVKMNCKFIGIEYSTSGQLVDDETGKNYGKYMRNHPEEVYEITGTDYVAKDEGRYAYYQLSGYMAGMNWAEAELIVQQKKRGPLTYQELFERENKPVWGFDFAAKKGSWAFVRIIMSTNGSRLAHLAGGKIRFGPASQYGKSWIAYDDEPSSMDSPASPSRNGSEET